MGIGVSYRIYPTMKWCKTYMELDSDVVTMINYQAYHALGIRSIFIRTHDGTVRELIDMRHVLDIIMNLLCVGAFETTGHKVVIKVGVLKIYH